LTAATIEHRALALAGLARPGAMPLFHGTAPWTRAGHVARLVMSWLPALDGMCERLAAGTTVADVGCGRGTSTIVMAQAFPRSTFTGCDRSALDIDIARRAADDAGVEGRVTFDVASPTTFAGGGFALVCTFDALHGAVDGASVARRVHRALGERGTWLLVERATGRRGGEAALHDWCDAAGFASVRRVTAASSPWVFEVRR
jgi:SAM-dependent methyltransferase